MKNRLSRLRKILADGKAQDMVEYALLAGFLAVAGRCNNAGHRQTRRPDRQQDREPFGRRGRHFGHWAPFVLPPVSHFLTAATGRSSERERERSPYRL